MGDIASDEWYNEVYLPSQVNDNYPVTTWDYVINDIRDREELGRLKYGKYLTPNTKEDMLKHAYEEALDLVVYLKTEILKREKDGSDHI